MARSLTAFAAMLFLSLSLGNLAVAQDKPAVPAPDDEIANAVKTPYVFITEGKVSATDFKEADGSCSRFYLVHTKTKEEKDADAEAAKNQTSAKKLPPTLAVVGTEGMKVWDLGGNFVAVYVPAGAIGQLGFANWDGPSAFKPASVWTRFTKGQSNLGLLQPSDNGFSWFQVLAPSEDDYAKQASATDVKFVNSKAEALRKSLTKLVEAKQLEIDLGYLKADPIPTPKVEEEDKPEVK